MAEMVFLRCDNGSRAARAACPKCGRISYQILKRPFAGETPAELEREVACPVCETRYRVCGTAHTARWEAAYLRYLQNSSAYNSAAKDNYTRQQAADGSGAEGAGTPIPQWQDLFTVTVLKRGEAYARRGAVNVVSADRELITAAVAGTEEHRVRISLKDRRITAMECTCSYARNGESCRHMAAVLYVAVNGITPDAAATGAAKSGGESASEEKAAQPAAAIGERDGGDSGKPVLTPAGGSAQPEGTAGFGEAVSLERKLTRWKKELLDTGKRNRMINYRETSRSTLKILEPGLEELFNKLAIGEKELSFQKPINKDSDYRTYAMLALLETLSYTLPVHVGDIKADGTVVEREKTLKNLRAKTKLAREEQGTNILYLSFGFILWRETDRAGAQWLKAPLLMMPATLEKKSLNAPYTISKYDDDIEVNPTLDYLFNAEYGIDLPTFELKDKSSITEYLDTIEEIVDRRGWKLLREVSLGLLSFQKINMYHDLNNDQSQQLIARHPVLRAMGGDYTAIKGLPPDIRSFDFDAVEPKDWHQVVNADSSQQEAILLSKRGVSFVMQGPPGTGKSQTITNIIAEALADGKKILFVSEKAAALQVVLKRLTEVGLSDLCLSLHDYKANKKVIIDNIGANLELKPKKPSGKAMEELTELMHSREALNEYAAELHKPIMPLECSIYSAYGRITKLEGATEVDFTLDDVLSVSKGTFSDMLYNVELLERALHTIGPLHENPWYRTTAASSGQAFKTRLEGQTRDLPAALPEIERSVDELTGRYGAVIRRTWTGVREGASELAGFLKLPLFPIEWSDGAFSASLLEAAKTARGEWESYRRRLAEIREEYLKVAAEGKQRQGELRRRLEALRSAWSDDALELDIDAVEGRFVKPYAGETDTMENCIHKASSSAEKLLEELRRVLGYLGQAKELLKLDCGGDLNGLYLASKIVTALADATYMEKDWFDPRKNAELSPFIDEACRHSGAIKGRTARLLENWERGILDVDAAGMLARFKTEYTGVFHKLKGSFREDIKTLRLTSRTVGAQITEEAAVTVLQEVQALNEEKAWFDINRERLTDILDKRYRGVDTDWVRLRRGMASALAIAELFPYANIPSEVVSAIRTALEDSEKSAKLRELNEELDARRLEALKNDLAEIGVLGSVTDSDPLDEAVIPRVEKFLEDFREQRDLLETLRACRNGAQSDISYKDIAELVELVSGIRAERRRLADEGEALSGLFGAAFNGEATDWDAIIAAADVSGAEQAKELERALCRDSARFAAQFGSRFAGVDTDWDAVIGDIEAVRAYLSSRPEGCAVSDRLIGTACGSAAARGELSERLSALSALMDTAEPEVAAFLALFENGDEYYSSELHDIYDRYERCMNGFDRLDQWIDLAETKRECDRLGLASFTDKLVKSDNSIPDVRDAFERGFYAQWIVPALERVPTVQTFRRRVHEQRLERFTALDEAQLATARDRIREKIISTFPDPYGVSGPKSEIGVLRHEMEKKRRIMPLRKLFRTIPDLLLTLKPCLMMSPLSVAYFLDAESYHFDMVIFDEASQIFPQDAVGAILRADQVIIAGDTKQLPPTNFFAASTGGADDIDLDEDGEWEDELYDSILEETANILPNRTLLWHYRSKNEQLIAFSNREIYRNELITFPGVNEREEDGGVELVYVEEGYFEGGGKNCNVLEARRCVELVAAHIERHPERSLGVIAFSEKQQQAIAKEIQLFREQNPKYEDFFREGREEEFFIKNLENVQGDERDTIIFSVGYAKTREQKAKDKPMAMRFGPLGVQGGERRLNVAITRAKRNIKLVSSILPSDIDLSKTESDGVRLLHDYIAFAMNGGASPSGPQSASSADEFKTSVAGFLREKGYDVRESVGCSGYRIDIAVRHPSRKEEYAAGIECDGLSYISARTARDRDCLRRSVLTSMGWNMYRVWSAEWYKNPEVEGKKLLSYIDGAIETVDGKLRRDEEQRRIEEERRAAERERARLAEEEAERERLLEEQRQQEAERQRIEEARLAAELRKEKAAKKRAGRPSKAGQTSSSDVAEKPDTARERDDICAALSAEGLTVIDNRASSSIVWAIYTEDKAEAFERVVGGFGARYTLEKRGSVATGNKPAWRIMIK